MIKPTGIEPRPCADVLDELEDRAQCCELQLVHYGKRRLFAGFVATVRCYEDNTLVREQLSEPGLGRILVIDGGGSLRCALLGGRLAQLARDNAWAGVIINGAVRDIQELREIDIGVCALGTSPKRSAKSGKSARDLPVIFGNATFPPAATVYCDDDGVAVVAS